MNKISPKRLVITKRGVEKKLVSKFWWTKREHAAFLRAVKKYGKDWTRISEIIKTKNRIQCKSHGECLHKIHSEDKNHPHIDLLETLGSGYTVERWTKKEKDSFKAALTRHGKNYEKI